jgi:LysM domain
VGGVGVVGEAVASLRRRAHAWGSPAGLVRHRLRQSLPDSASRKAARYLAPAAFLLAVTAGVLVLRSSLRSDPPAAVTTPHRATRPGVVGTVAHRAAPSAQKQYYVIRSGDTLGGIASRLSTSVEALLRLNPGIEPTAMHPGEHLRIK